MSSADQDVDTGGGTGTGVQTIVKEKIKEMVEVRTRRINIEVPRWLLCLRALVVLVVMTFVR